MEHQSLIAAFVVGILGGVHCIGMCGGIVAALSIGTTRINIDGGPSDNIQLSYLFTYNIARVLSYTLMGVVFGWLGASVIDLIAVNTGQQLLKIIAGIFMILLGMYLANWWRLLSRLEGLGAIVWKHIEPVGRRFIPIKNIHHAFVLGLIWGWLPCGLVYSVLIWSLSSGSAVQGGLLMLAFGLGTLPNLILMGLFATALRKFTQQRWVQAMAGTLVAVLGCYQIYQSLVLLA